MKTISPDGATITETDDGKAVRSWSFASRAELEKQRGEFVAEIAAAPALKAELDAITAERLEAEAAAAERAAALAASVRVV
jgi:hypothetical protein